MSKPDDDPWALLWGHLLGPDARDLLAQGIPIGYVKSLYQHVIPHRNDTYGRTIALELLRILADAMHRAGLGRQFGEIFTEVCAARGYTIAEVQQGFTVKPAWHWSALYPSIVEVEHILVGRDPGAILSLEPIEGALKTLTHALGYWLWADDASLREDPSWEQAAGFAWLYLDALDTCATYRARIAAHLADAY